VNYTPGFKVSSPEDYRWKAMIFGIIFIEKSIFTGIDIL